MKKTLADIATELEQPFAIKDIELLPKSQIERDGKTMRMALPYADVRVYQDRLNALAPGEWSTPSPTPIVVGQKLVVYVSVTVCGVTHTDVGEAPASGENAATESWAQAFKRAASHFGLGRYLYDLEKAWVSYDPKRKQIALDAAGIQNTVRQMYNKAHIPVAGGSAPATQPAPQTDEPQGEPAAYSLIEEARRAWAQAYHISNEAVLVRWKKYLVFVLGRKYEDDELTAAHLARLNEDIARQQTVASTRKAS